MRKVGGVLEIFTKSRAQGGKANAEIVKELRRLTKKEVAIASGLKSRDKTIIIKDAEESDLEGAYD